MTAANAVFKLVSVAAPTSTGNQNVAHTLGATPKLAAYFANKCTAIGSSVSGENLSVGATDGSRQWNLISRARQSVNPSNTEMWGMLDQVVGFLLAGSSNIDGEAAHSSWDATNHVINWGNAPGTANMLLGLFATGSDLSVYVDDVALTTEDTAIALTSGWRPDAAIVITSYIGTWGDSSSDNLRFGIGVLANASGTLKQKCFAISAQDNISPTENNTTIMTDRCGCIVNTDDTIAYSVEGAFTDTGATFTARENDANRTIGVILLKCVNANFNIVDITLPITSELSGGNYAHNVGLQADVAMLFTGQQGTTGTAASPNIVTGSNFGHNIGIAIPGIPQEHQFSFRDRDAQTTSSSRESQYSTILDMFSHSSDTTTHTASVDSNTSPNLTLAYTVTPASGNSKGFALAIQLSTGSTLSAPTPSGTLTTQTTADIGCTTDVTDGAWFVIVDTASLSGIDYYDIENGKRPDGATAVVYAGNAAISTTTPSKQATGLTAGTAYNYAGFQRTAAGLMSNIVTGSFTTDVAAISSATPTGTIGTQTTANIGCTTDTSSGTLYCVADTVSLAGIESSDIKAGKLQDGTTDADAAASGAVSGSTPANSVAGLIADTTYNTAQIQAVNGADSNILFGSFTTAAAPSAEFSATPSVTPQSGGYQVGFTVINSSETVYGVVVEKGSTAPSSAQIVLGHNANNQAALDADSVAATQDVPTSITFNGLTFPVHDIYLSLDGNVTALTSKYKTAPSGYEYTPIVLAGAPPEGSVLDASAVTDDVLESSTTASPSAATVTPDEQGFFEIDSPVTGRQLITYRVYSLVSKTWYTVTGYSSGTYADLYINNQVPVEITAVPEQNWFTHQFYAIQLEGTYFQDGENDPCTLEIISGAFPAGVTLVEYTDPSIYHRIEGEPTETGVFVVRIKVTDAAGDILILTDITINVTASVQVPYVENNGTSLPDAIIAIVAAGIIVDEIAYADDAMDVNDVISTTPPHDEWVLPGSSVDLVVSGVVIPDVTGNDVSTAIATLEALGLIVNITYVISDTDSLVVTSQLPDSGNVVGYGSDISLNVSIVFITGNTNVFKIRARDTVFIVQKR